MSELFDMPGDTGNDLTGHHSSSDGQNISSAGLMLPRTCSSHPQPATASEPTVSGLTQYRGVPAFGLLQHAAEQVPNRDALRYDDEIWSYKELNDATIRCAALFQSLGIKPGDRIGILLPNVPEFIIAANGAWRAGAVVVALSPLMVADEVEKLVRHTDCKVVVSLDLLSHLCEGAKSVIKHMLHVSIRKHLPGYKQLGYLWMRHRHTGHWTLPSTETSSKFWDAMEKTTTRWRPITIDPLRDAAYILPTGGTTGVPKAVTLSHTNLVANAWQQYVWTNESFGTEVMMAVLPFFHSYGLSTTAMAGPAMGATLVMHHRYNTRKTIQLIEKHQPSVLHAVPAMLVALNERLASHPADLSSIRWVISGGAPLDETVAQDFVTHSGAQVVEGFGLSEASPVTHVGHLFNEPRYGVIGLPLPETKCRIVDTETGCHEVPYGDVGELIIRGPQVMLGYWRDREATAATIRDGWLHTGDLAMCHDDGYYSIVGRKKDLIITSGYNVYPCEVEAAIRECELVEDVAVIGIPDPKRGEVVTAVIVLTKGATWDEDAINNHCAVTLSKHKRPRILKRCDGDLPRNFLGKVVRRALRESNDSITAEAPAEENK